MPERLYTEYPELYDAIQSDWEYDRDVAFVLEALDRHGIEGRSLLELGCGTGQHTHRFEAEGFDVTAVDRYAGMLERAAARCNADLRREVLPDISIDQTFDIVVAIRGVVNHLPPEALEPTLQAVADHLEEGGLFVFDNSPLPRDGNAAGLDVGETAHGEYARIAQMQHRSDGRLEWVSATFLSSGEWFINRRPMTPFSDRTVAATLSRCGFAVHIHHGFGPEDDRSEHGRSEDDRTVFVAVDR